MCVRIDRFARAVPDMIDENIAFDLVAEHEVRIPRKPYASVTLFVDDDPDERKDGKHF